MKQKMSKQCPLNHAWLIHRMWPGFLYLLVKIVTSDIIELKVIARKMLSTKRQIKPLQKDIIRGMKAIGDSFVSKRRSLVNVFKKAWQSQKHRSHFQGKTEIELDSAVKTTWVTVIQLSYWFVWYLNNVKSWTIGADPTPSEYSCFM